MKKIALGVVAAATIFTAVPAMAQVGFYAGPGGIGVGVGPPAPAYGYLRSGLLRLLRRPGRASVTPGVARPLPSSLALANVTRQ